MVHCAHVFPTSREFLKCSLRMRARTSVKCVCRLCSQEEKGMNEESSDAVKEASAPHFCSCREGVRLAFCVWLD